MPDALRLFLEPDTDGTAELFAEVTSGSFAGTSSAWFGLTELRDFGLRLQSTYPIQSEAPLELVGGFWSKTEHSIEQLHVGLKFYPIHAVGNIGVEVQLATHVSSNERVESQRKVRVELITHYESISRFGRELVSLAKGTTRSAVLEANGG